MNLSASYKPPVVVLWVTTTLLTVLAPVWRPICISTYPDCGTWTYNPIWSLASILLWPNAIVYFIFFALILLPLYRQWSSKKLFTGFLIGVSIIAVVANILLLPYILPSLKQGREDATLLKNFENDFEQIKLGMPKSQAHQMIVSNLEKLPKKLQNDPLTPMPSILPKIENRASLINGRLYGDPNQDPLVNATDTDPEVINLLHTYLTQNPKAKIKFDSCEYSPSNGIVFSFYLCYKNDRLAYKAHGNAFEHRNYTGPNPPPRIEVIQASAKLDPNILRQLIAQPEF